MLNLIGVIIAFIVIIVLIRKKFNFGLSLIVGSLIIGIFSLQTIKPIDIPKAFIQGIVYNFEDQQINTETIELAVLMTLIFVLAKCMQETGAIKKLIDSLRTFFSKGGTLGVIPAIYGLMPVPGGALFSAPLIDKEGENFNLNKNQKNFLNVWFRHIWFPIYPISSAMILVCSTDFSDIYIYKLIAANIPAFIAFIVIGLIYLKIFTKNKCSDIPKPAKKNYSGLVYLLPPILPILFYIGLLLVGFSDVKDYQRIVFILGVVASIVLLFVLVRLEWPEFRVMLKKSLSINLALAIFGIMIFREMFEVSKSNVIIANMINNLAFPAIIIVIIVPLVLGLMTGYNLGAIALSYFLVEPFFEFTSVSTLGLTSLIFMSSLVGYLISPIHLCNVVSSDYLKTDTTRMYKMYIPASISLLVVQTVFVILFLHS